MKMGDKISKKDIEKWYRLKMVVVCPECLNKIRPYKTHGIVGCPVCGAEFKNMKELREKMKAALEKEHEKHENK